MAIKTDAKVKKGLAKIRQSLKKKKKVSDAVIESIQSSKDGDIKAALGVIEDLPSVCKALIKMDGILTNAKVEKLGINLADCLKKGKKEKEQKEDKMPSKKRRGTDSAATEKGDKVEVKLVSPVSLTCPDEDDKGNQVVMVMAKDGLVGCGVVDNQPKD